MAVQGAWRAGPLAMAGFQALERGDAQGAAELFKRAVATEGRAGPVLQGLGLALSAQKRFAEARQALEQALAQGAKDAGLLANLGGTCVALGDFAAAERYCRRAVKLVPGLAPAWNSLGLALLRQDRADDAEAALRQATVLAPASTQYLANWREAISRGIAKHIAAGRFDALLDFYEDVLTIDSQWEDARYERACLLLRRGELAGGWPDYAVKYDDLPRFPMPVWDGSPLRPEQVLLVRSEQGIGEQVMFASTLPDLFDVVPHPVVEVDARLVPLFARSFPGIDFVGWYAPPDPRLANRRLDRQIALGRLPSLFRPDFSAFGSGAPYLVADEARVAERRAAWRCDDRPVVGISWASGRSPVAARKNVPLEAWRPIFEQPGLRFVCLQYDPAEDDLVAIRATGAEFVVDPELDPIGDLDGFAAAIRACDLVLTISNNTAHFGGALGVPTWVMLSENPLWQWFASRDDSPWYGSVALFRRRFGQDWSAVTDQVAARLPQALGLSSAR